MGLILGRLNRGKGAKWRAYGKAFTSFSAHKYKISTHTGDVRGAGTDADVFITLFSKDGCSPEMKLNDSKNNFERKR